MGITLTSKRDIDYDTIADMLVLPYRATAARIRNAALQKAAIHYVEHHKWILTLQTLPEDLYKMLPDGDDLAYLQPNGRGHTIGLDKKFPLIKNLIVGGYNWVNNGVPHDDLFAKLPEVLEEYNSATIIEEKGNTFNDLIVEYLNAAAFRSVTQLCWSAPEMVAALLHINNESPRYRRNNRDFLLAQLSKRRYLSHSDKRRPAKVHYMPDTLKPYLGEAKLLHTANTSED